MDNNGKQVDDLQELGQIENTRNVAQTAGDNSPVYQDSFNTTKVDRPELGLPWIHRPGAPHFRLSPGEYEGKLLCTFYINATIRPGTVEAKWSGVGTDTEWKMPMDQNVRKPGEWGYQMKPAAMAPTPPNDRVTFEIRFYLEDGQHGAQWHWPLEQHSKGHWSVEAQKGSGVGQPKLEDTW